MARKLADKQNVQAPDSDYPFGRIKDVVPSVAPGTPVDEDVYGDFHQFFEKLMAAAGITANKLPDNDYSGFQLFEAYKIASYEAWRIPSFAGAYQSDGTSLLRYRRRGKTIRIKGKLDNSVPASVSSKATVFTLPSGYRPAELQLFSVAADVAAGAGFINIVEIDASGVVSMRGDLIAFNNTAVYLNITFDID